MRIAIIGSQGQLGTALLARGGDVEIVPLTHADIEIADPVSVVAALSRVDARVVINAAAYNFVDQAEDDPAAAFAGNAWGPQNLALWCAAHDRTLVHVSTDYVFGLDAGRSEPYDESDLPGPVSNYGASKLAGESIVRSLCPRHFVVRTCGLYGPSTSRKKNFVSTMLSLAATRAQLRVVDDQRCTPTNAADLADTLLQLVRTEAYGLFHVTNRGSATWCEFAREILRLAGIRVNVAPLTTAEYGAIAPRPRYSVLDCAKVEGVVGAPLREWRAALEPYVRGGVGSGQGGAGKSTP